MIIALDSYVVKIIFCAAGSMLDGSVYIAKLFTFRKCILVEVMESGCGKPSSSLYGVSFLLGSPNLYTTLSLLYFLNFLHHDEGPSSEYADICERHAYVVSK